MTATSIKGCHNSRANLSLPESRGTLTKTPTWAIRLTPLSRAFTCNERLLLLQWSNVQNGYGNGGSSECDESYKVDVVAVGVMRVVWWWW